MEVGSRRQFDAVARTGSFLVSLATSFLSAFKISLFEVSNRCGTSAVSALNIVVSGRERNSTDAVQKNVHHMELFVRPASDTSVNPRATRRILFHPSVMREVGLATGDVVTLAKSEKNEEPQQVSRTDVFAGPLYAVGIAWPSTTLAENEVGVSEMHRRNAALRIGDFANVTTVPCEPLELKRVVLKPLAPFPFNDTSFELYASEVLVDIRYVCVNNIVGVTYGGVNRLFRVSDISFVGGERDPFVGHVTRKTDVIVIDDVPKKKSSVGKDEQETVNYSAIGGLETQIKIVRELVELPLKQPELFGEFGLRPPRGVLLYGPPGTGKTLLARAVAAETQASVYLVNGAEIVSKYYGETEKKLRDLFTRARETAPSIIFIDEIDALCPKRDEASGELEKRVVATLLTLMDGSDAHSTDKAGNAADRVVVIGATNRPNSLDEALRRPGRFDREVEIGIPNSAGRTSILSAHLQRIPHSLSIQDINDVASKAHGYVGADLAAVCREGGIKAVKRAVTSGLTDLGKLMITKEDLITALGEVRPSAMREILLDVPSVPWSSIGGQDDIKQKLRESVEWPLQHPEAFARLGIRPPKGILLYGPPGCSKTLMAKALATEGGLNFIAVKGPELFSKWVGESEKAVREVFRRARAASPSIVFFDEIDAITVRRGGEGGGGVSDRVLAQLLSELDGVEPLTNVTVIAATNRPDIIDPALMRPGRIDRVLYIGPPDLASRREILRIQIARMSVASDVDVAELAVKTEGCSGAEVVALCQEAALCAMDEDRDALEVRDQHFQLALSSLSRRITKEMIKFYDDFREATGVRNLS